MSSGITDQSATQGTNESIDKGKGKAIQPAEETEDETSDEEMPDPDAMDVEEDDDDLAEIDSNNIIQNGRRTRGKNIDFAKAAAAEPAGDDDDDDDEDFVAAGEDGDKDI